MDNPGFLKLHKKQLDENSIKTSNEWPEFLFREISRKRIASKIVDQGSHLDAIKVIPKQLMRDYRIGETIEIGDWFFTSIEPIGSKSEESQWILTIASKSGEDFLYFTSVW